MSSNRVAVVACAISVLSFAAAGALYLEARHQQPPVINVQPAPVTVQTIPAPAVTVQAASTYKCTPEQAEAGECLPLLEKADKEKTREPVPLPRERPAMFSTADGRQVTRIEVEMTRDKPKALKKKQRDAKKKLQKDWNRAQSSFPDIFKGFR